MLLTCICNKRTEEKCTTQHKPPVSGISRVVHREFKKQWTDNGSCWKSGGIKSTIGFVEEGVVVREEGVADCKSLSAVMSN